MCAGFVCECQGGFRSDHDVCLHEGTCLIDVDCGPAGYCSPTWGDCGSYSGTVGYYCHTPNDDCLDDADCAASGTQSYTTDEYQTPSLRGFGQRRKLLSNGVVADVDALLDPTRQIPGHAYGMELDAAAREDLLELLRGL